MVASKGATDMRNRTEEMKSAAADKLGEIRNSIEDYYEKGVHQVKNLERNVEGKIRRRPIQSVLIAAGVAATVGVFVGLMSRRR